MAISKATYVLVLNCGSSSVKFALIEPNTEETILSGLIECIGDEHANISWRYQQNAKQYKKLAEINYQSAFDEIVALISDTYSLTNNIFAVGHRVVHGGEKFTKPALINKSILAAVKSCVRLAPLHNPANIAGIEAATRIFPKLPQIAVFDTAFHQTMPKHAYIYPIPYQLYTDHGVRRYGFHGISHQFVTQKAAQQLGCNLKKSAFISAHLGNGCSATAVLNGKSIDTSMGLTPLEGLVMGTRSGDVDPSLHAYLADNLGYDVHKVTNLLNKESGLLGISQKYSDMRAIEKAITKQDEHAILAAEIACYRLAKYIASLAVPLGKIDALIFTGGIGENSDFIRGKTLSWLEILGFEPDIKRNAAHGKTSNGIITTDQSRHKALVIATNEELLIAQETAEHVK